ncbi:hypothetical protein JTB14_005349 [Gonioctena quinquepunctata]|nr:hypothetical protein JTB14_005349 [Gonioctena quinquepunctata]
MNYIKLLIFSVLFGIILTQNAEGEEVFLVGNKRCITNGSSALTFIKNIHDTAVDDNKDIFERDCFGRPLLPLAVHHLENC